MSIHYEERNTTEHTCHNCGGVIEPGRGQRIEEWGYPWDGSDTEGSIAQKLGEWHVHFEGDETCMRAACASGHNLDFLRDLFDNDTLNQTWREMARTSYNAHAKGSRELAEMIARGEEGAMREAGWGGIGGSQGSGE